LADVLQREKFDRYLTTPEREEFLEALVEQVTFIQPTEEIRVCRDSRDDKFFELAVAGNADYIITGDDDLLVLNPYRGIAILTAAEFLAAVKP
jgi:putative PIN family toxin of toxin-antitoxin system